LDGKLVSNSPFNTVATKGGEGSKPSAPSSYGEIFDKLFPYYLSIGMTERQYWDDDSSLARAYREAEELRQTRANQAAWLQGAYVYDAIIRIAPVLQAFAKKGTKPQPYLKEPYPITEKEARAAEQRAEQKLIAETRAMWEAFMVNNNKKFERKE